MMSQSATKDHYQILVLGGGTAGITVAAQLRRKLKNYDLAIVEPSTKHYYQPLWTLVGAGVFPKEQSQRAESAFIPKGATWIEEQVAELQPEQNVPTDAVVGPAGAERVAAVEGEPERKRHEQRRGERDEREANGVTRAPKVTRAAEEANAEVEREPEDEVADRSIDPARDERPDRHQGRVVVRVVEEVGSRRRRENGGHAGEQDDRQQRLRTRCDVVVVLLAQGEEDRPRADEHRRHTQPPRAGRRELARVTGRVQEHGASVAACSPTDD